MIPINALDCRQKVVHQVQNFVYPIGAYHGAGD
jgi:hypothetical protein